MLKHISTSFLFIVKSYKPVGIYHIRLSHSLADGQVDCFYASMKTGVHISWTHFLFLWLYTKDRITGSYATPTFPKRLPHFTNSFRNVWGSDFSTSFGMSGFQVTEPSADLGNTAILMISAFHQSYQTAEGLASVFHSPRAERSQIIASLPSPHVLCWKRPFSVLLL